MLKWLSFYLLFALAVPQQNAELISVFAEGNARLNENNLMLSRNAAKENALNKALWNVVRMLLAGTDIQKNAEEINALVISRGMSYVQSYKFINELVDEDKQLYMTDLQFTFFMDGIRTALTQIGLTAGGGSKPKIVLLIDDRAIGALQDASFLLLSSDTEQSLSSSISKLGFTVVSRVEIRKLKNDARVLKAINGDRSEVVWLAEQYQAAYVILGKARSVIPPQEGEEAKWVEGEIDASIYEGKTASVLWKKQVVERVTGDEGAAGFRAIRLAGKRLNRNVVDFLYESAGSR